MVRESPAVIGAMTMSMQIQPSMENGLLFAIQHNDGALSMRLKEVLWKPLSRSSTSLTSSFLDFSASLSEENESLRQSLHLIMSSTCERTKEGVDRLLDKANMVILSGIRDSVDKYVASLSAPTMVLFALGVLLPVMLFSLVPLISVGASFNISETGMEEGTGSKVPMSMLGLLLLIVFPISSFIHARSIIARSPLQICKENDITIDRNGITFLFIWISIIVIVLLVDLGEYFSYFMLFALVLPPSTFLCILLRKNHIAQRKKVERERDYVRAIFQIGSRMASGSSFEAALEDTSRSKAGSKFSEIIDSVLYKAMMSRSNLRELLMDELDSQGTSSILCGAFRTIVECSEKNPKGAGQVAMNLAQYLSDLNSCEIKIEERLKSLVDMMQSTSMVFAPIVLGITSSLIGLISEFGNSSSELITQTVLMVGIYVVELVAVISYFTVFLLGHKTWKEVGYEFGRRAPVGLAIFISVSIFCQIGLTRLL